MRVRVFRFPLLCPMLFAGWAFPPLAMAQSYTISTFAGDWHSTTYTSCPAKSANVLAEGVVTDGSGNGSLPAKSFVARGAARGNIHVYAGALGAESYSGDGGPAISATLAVPLGLALGPGGSLYIADFLNNRIRKVTSAGIITTYAGGGSPQFPSIGDNGPAPQAALSFPSGIAFDPAGNAYIADTNHNCIHKVDTSGTITTFAGTFPGTGQLFGGYGGPAAGASLSYPKGVAVGPDGSVYIADTGNNRIRKVDPTGIISTVAGSGSGSYSGDNGPAKQAGISAPQGVAVDAAGNLFIADTGDDRVRMVSPGGTIITIAGNGAAGQSGDGGPATAAALDSPIALAFGPGGVIYVANYGDEGSGYYSRVSLLTPAVDTSQLPAVASGGVVSASAFGKFSTVAPGSWIEIYGSNLASTTAGWTGSDFQGPNAPTSLEGTSVSIGGERAFVAYVSPSQVNVQVPSGVGSGSQSLVVTTAAGSSPPVNVMVAAEEPGLLAPASFDVNGVQYAAAFFPDGHTFVLPPGAITGLASRRAQPGDVITFYGVGFGPVTPSILPGVLVGQANSLALPFHLTIGSAEATLQYDGLAPSEVGVYQFNAVVPGIPSSDDVPVTFTLGGVSSTQPLHIAVQNGAAPVEVKSLSLSTSTVAGGSTLTGTVTLTGPAPAQGASIALASSSSSASVPASVAVPSGAASVTFTITTQTVTSSVMVTISASYNGPAVTQQFTLSAPVPAPFQSVDCLVTFEPSGYPSSQITINITPNAGNLSFTGDLISMTFINGVPSNNDQTFTFTAFQAGIFNQPPVLVTSTGSYEVSSAALTITLKQSSPYINLLGTVSGTMSVTGTPYPQGGAAVTLSGQIVGTYTLLPAN